MPYQKKAFLVAIIDGHRTTIRPRENQEPASRLLGTGGIWNPNADPYLVVADQPWPAVGGTLKAFAYGYPKGLTQPAGAAGLGGGGHGGRCHPRDAWMPLYSEWCYGILWGRFSRRDGFGEYAGLTGLAARPDLVAYQRDRWSSSGVGGMDFQTTRMLVVESQGWDSSHSADLKVRPCYGPHRFDEGLVVFDSGLNDVTTMMEDATQYIDANYSLPTPPADNPDVPNAWDGNPTYEWPPP